MNRIYLIVFSILLFCYLLLGFSHPNTAFTQDLGRHLLLGGMILKTGSVPKTNLFSYTYPDFPFINTHYLSEVIFSLLSSVFGVDSLLYFTLFIILITFGVLFISAKKNASLLGIGLGSLLLIPVLFERTAVRPEIFSFLFASLFITLLYKNRKKPTWLIYLLIPLTFLWTQMHIYFAVGGLLLFLFLLDGLLSKNLRKRSSYVKTLSIVFVGSSLITILNPNGIHGALYPFHVFDNYGYSIEENQTMFLLQSLGFLKPSFPYFIGSVITLFFILFLRIKKAYPIDWLLAICFTYIAGSAVRNFPLFAIILFIPFTRLLTDSIRLIGSQIPHSQRTILYHISIFIVSGLVVWQIIGIIQNKDIGFETKDPGQNALSFFISEEIKGPIFNNFDIGSYLIYRLYPQESVFVDGRPEAYPASFFKDVYIPMQQSQELFTIISEQYKFNAIVFSHTDLTPWAQIFLSNIVINDTWSTVYLDSTMIILVKNIPDNKAILKQHGMSFDSLAFSHYDKTNLANLIPAANFADVINHKSLQKQTFQDILAIDSTNCPVLYNFVQILEEENDPLSILYASKYHQTCVR